MPEDTKAGQILDYLERYSGSIVCSKQLYKEALGHDYDGTETMGAARDQRHYE